MLVKVKNLYGYPSLTDGIRKYAKDNGILLIVDRSALARLEDKMSDQFKILVEAPPTLATNHIPVLGFKDHNGVFFRMDLPHKSQLVANEIKVKIPRKLDRLSPSMLSKALKAPNKSEFLATLDEKSEDYRMVKNMINRYLPASLNDPFEPPKAKKMKEKKERHGT
jgi:hypothetical protein